MADAENPEKKLKNLPRYYMSIPGIRGEIRGGPWDSCFALSSAQFGMGRAVSSRSKVQREVSSPSWSEVTISAEFNAQWNLLAGLSMGPALFEKVYILFGRSDGTLLNKMTLGNAVQSSFSCSGSRNRNVEGHSMSLSCSWNFCSFEMETTTIIRKPMQPPQDIDLSKDFSASLPFRDPGHDCWALIFQNLNQFELYCAAQVCKAWFQAACSITLKETETHSFCADLLAKKHPGGVDGYRLPPLHPSLKKSTYRRGNASEDEEEEAPIDFQDGLKDPDEDAPFANKPWFGSSDEI